MKTQDIESDVPHLVSSPELNREGPIVLLEPSEEVAEDPQTRHSINFDFRSIKSGQFSEVIRKGFRKTFPETSPEALQSHDPEDWSVELRKFKEPTLVKIENFDALLGTPEAETVSTLLCHIACESHYSVLLSADRNKLNSLESLPGFQHLGSCPDGLCTVPECWAPPKYFPRENLSEKANGDGPGFTSNLILGSATLISMAAVVLAFWVSAYLNNSERSGSSQLSKTMDTEGRAGMRTISVSSPREIEWGKPPADRGTVSEIMSEQIPVSFPKTDLGELGGKLAERIDIEAIEKYHAKVFEKLDTKSILSFQPIPEDEVFFEYENDSGE